MTNLHRWISIALLLSCIVLAFIPFKTSINTQLGDMLIITLAVYALARGLNAVVSMAQGTELSIEPLGVGVTLAPGEILDPINDLIEQVSTVLLIASASIGMQKIMVSMGDIIIFRWLLFGMSFLALTLFFVKKMPLKLHSNIIKVVLILSLLRCVVPAMVVASNYAQDYLTEDRQQAISVLVETQKDVNAFNQSNSEDRSWYETMKPNFDTDANLELIKQKAERAVEASVYILSEFALVFVVLPIVLMWLFLALFKRVLN